MKQTALYKDGNVVSYAEYGDAKGYPVFIQHGLIASIDDYGLFERLLRFGARLICMARPGYGASSPYGLRNIGEWADIVGVLIAELKVAQFDILGISSGAPYSYAIGYKFPDRVRNIYILSGIPALYDEGVQAYWPYALNKNATMAELEELARELFFSNLSEEALQRNDIHDSMMNNCFGLAQDLKLRGLDWGFSLSDVTAPVYMQHSRLDEGVPFETAMMTSKLLPNCKFEVKEDGGHFSDAILDDFIETVISGHYES